MDLAQLADLEEFIGGVAVLVTLVYLALQVRQGTNLSTSAAQFAIVSEFNRLHEAALVNPQVAQLLLRAKSREPLEPVWERQLRAHANRLFNAWVAAEQAYTHGALDRTFFDLMKVDVANSCAQWPPLADYLNEILRSYPQLRELRLFASLRERGQGL